MAVRPGQAACDSGANSSENAGSSFLNPAVVAKPIEDCARRVQGAAPVAGREPLSAREREVFKLIAEGTLSIVEMVFRA